MSLRQNEGWQVMPTSEVVARVDGSSREREVDVLESAISFTTISPLLPTSRRDTKIVLEEVLKEHTV